MKHGIVFILLLSIIGVKSGNAADEQRSEFKEKNNSQSGELNSREQYLSEDSLQAESWGITITEWKKYQSIMKGKRGIWTPDLDPITVLGTHADTAEEQERYAEIYVRLQIEREQKELEFGRAIMRAQKKLQGDKPMFDYAALEAEKRPPLPSHDRLVLFSRLDCPECDGILSGIFSAMSAQSKMDIYVVGASSDDDVREFGARYHVPLDAVREGRITLNHDNGTFLSVASIVTPLPHFLVRMTDGSTKPYQGFIHPDNHPAK